MEFRCRVATATGQVTEATYIAESEVRLRSELEEKGLYLLSVQGGVHEQARRWPSSRERREISAGPFHRLTEADPGAISEARGSVVPGRWH